MKPWLGWIGAHVASIVYLCGHIGWGAGGVCDLRIYIRDPSGKPTDTMVRVVDEAGAVRVELQSRNGVAEVCDVGLHEVSVIVGGDFCGQTIVRRIKRLEPESLVVTYHNCHTQRVHSPCLVLIRVRLPDGSPAAGASLRMGAIAWTGRSDQYGRLFVPLDRFGAHYPVTISLSGYEDRSVDLECSTDRTRQEVPLVMKAKQR